MSLKGSHSNIEFNDHSEEIIKLLGEAVVNGLEAIGMTAETYAKKECPVDTGRLRNSITYAIAGEQAHVKEYRAYRRSESEKNDNSKRAIYNYDGVAPGEKGECVYIGTNVEYAEAVELGTSKMPARPFLRPAATEHGPEYKRIMEAALESAK